jgi:hypothetical protein
MITAVSQEDERQLALLNTDTGAIGSGTTRYAAAMYFYQLGQMSVRHLEIYRSLAKDDVTEPKPLLFER